MRFMRRKEEEYQGTPSDLYAELLHILTPEERRSWPKNPQAMSRELRRLGGALSNVGLHLTFGHAGRGNDKSRWIVVEHIGGDGGDAGDASIDREEGP